MSMLELNRLDIFAYIVLNDENDFEVETWRSPHVPAVGDIFFTRGQRWKVLQREYSPPRTRDNGGPAVFVIKGEKLPEAKRP